MSKTPRTDAAIHKFWMGGSWSIEFADFARQLESENAEMAELLDDACAALEMGEAETRSHVALQIRALLAKVNG